MPSVKIKENAVEENSFEDGVNHYLELTKLYKKTLRIKISFVY